MPLDYIRLSKSIAHALRHAPEQYGLELDAEGWVAVDDLLAALRQRRASWRHLTRDDIETMLARATKQRYELQGDRIRAYYGHSVPQLVERAPAVPPEVLFHGTSPRALDAICDEGLQPMRRQFVHLSTDEATARDVGSRHSAQPVIVTIRARDAHEAGVRFFLGNEDVWLADPIPAAFIDIP